MTPRSTEEVRREALERAERIARALEDDDTEDAVSSSIQTPLWLPAYRPNGASGLR